MKRRIKELVTKEANMVCKEGFISGLAAVIAVLVAVAFSIYLWKSLDFVEATEEDYKPLFEKSETIKNHQSLLEHNGTIVVEDDILKVSFENEECKIIVSYNKKNFKKFAIERIDKAEKWWDVGFWIAVLEIHIWALCYLFVIGIVTIVKGLYRLCRFAHERIERKKSK